MEFKDRIKTTRMERGISPAQLAGYLGKSESAVRAWEIERSKPDADTLIKLAKYFNCTTDYLLGLSDYKNSVEKDEFASACDVLNEAVAKISNGASLLRNLALFVDIAVKKDMGGLASQFLTSASFFLQAMTEIDQLTNEIQDSQTYDVVSVLNCMLRTADRGTKAKKSMLDITLQLLHLIRLLSNDDTTKVGKELTNKFLDVYAEKRLEELKEIDDFESPIYSNIDLSPFL